ncbi:hypothetical protein M0R45_012694 [Rubus argutus]|uniref:Secreted protein n=1 Tax=Rubus argutus TaxID=59490 RepID=A0AAW1XJ18_RUBAR
MVKYHHILCLSTLFLFKCFFFIPCAATKSAGIRPTKLVDAVCRKTYSVTPSVWSLCTATRGLQAPTAICCQRHFSPLTNMNRDLKGLCKICVVGLKLFTGLALN